MIFLSSLPCEVKQIDIMIFFLFMLLCEVKQREIQGLLKNKRKKIQSYLSNIHAIYLFIYNIIIIIVVII